MSLDGSALGVAIKNQLIGDGNAIDSPEMTAAWDSVGNAIADYIVANTVVNTNTTGLGLPVLPVQVAPLTGTGATTLPDVITGTGVGTIS